MQKISGVGVALPPSFKKPMTLKRVDADLKIKNDLHLTKIAKIVSGRKTEMS